jgi:ketosteroid isomerase-like protein
MPASVLPSGATGLPTIYLPVGRVKTPSPLAVGKVWHPRGDVSRPDYYGNPAGGTSDIEVVRAIYAAFAARDLEAALPYLARDCELHLRGTQARIGREEPYRGHDGMREYYADVERTWEDLVLFADDFRTIPGAVIVMGHVEGRIAGEPVKRTAVWTWKVEDGKATEVKVADVGPAP